ncbi:SDR family oxidoreductase [Amycolatopsis sp. K13G38]|uniref:SDR family oxidoreductase n=1 Tax=Amycolatopsis acididurans TaxID=2724524 RepID=A0ABX1JA90_9PSEU|nr:SDR family oxidoreductase [Amycolatopsis acididurans]NKQ55460.1 SDR family oxidoreductase [Amycolatopsis acididurans]
MTDSIPNAAEGFDFSGSGVLIAGGTSGVGLATAVAFALAGCRRLMLLGRNEERGKRAVDEVLGTVTDARAEFLPADANDPASAAEAAAETHRRLGGIDILVNSVVAPYQPTPLHEIPVDDVRNILTQQALGPLLMSRAVLPFLREQGSGSIINIASDAAKVPTPGETCLGAAMAAIVTFSRTLALEAKRYGVRVNAITPSLIANTGSYDRAMSQPFSKKIFERITGQAHLGLTEPEDLANLTLFLASPLARLITGQVVSVNGGISVA